MDTHLNMQGLGWHHVITGSKQNFDLIPTWQVGVSQEQDSDYANLIREGYRKHAIIHACVSLLASSAALPALRVFRQDDPLDSHPVLDLLQRPNVWQSETEFRELLLTHLLITGNAYVELVRGGGVVVEMGLLRPDRVTIKPGVARDDDLYVYAVGDKKRSIPQADVIHFRLPNPTNDFYGLSPIEAISRETNLDIDMTQLAKAFFDNAGVPFGLLTVPRNTTEDQKEQIKGVWRRAFNKASDGVRRFFSLLVLNADSATYQELGKAPKDLAMEELRFETETRMCMAYRVPPIMVAARVGLQFATYSNFETAEKVFWRYGVGYYLGVIRDRLNAELMSEVRRTSDSGLRLDYDLSAVPALAEDNTEKLKAVAELVKGGGFTGNQALSLVGLNAVDGADFYVRSLTQVAERPLGDGKSMMLAPPVDTKERRAQRLGGVVNIIKARIAARMEPDLEDFFAEQSAEVRRRLEELAKGITGIRESDVFPDGQDEELLRRLNGHYRAADEAIHVAFSAELALGEFDPEGPIVRRILERAAQRVVGINDVTRVAIRDVLAVAEERGYALRQVVNGVADDEFPGLSSVVEETYKNRAMAVARTESGYACNDASLGRYAEAGVRHVTVFDGDEDEPCAAANGATWTLAEADGNSLAHPNCLVGDSLVLAPNLQAAFLRRFEGEVIILRTAQDDLLTCTPNHPILTDRGWRAAQEIAEGDYVLRSLDGQRVARLLDPDNDQVPARIEDVVSATLKAGACTPRAMPSSTEDFHGDGMESNVYVVGADGLGERRAGQHRGQLAVERANMGLITFLADGAAAESSVGMLGAANGGVGSGGLGLPLLWREGRHSEVSRFAAGSQSVTSLAEGRSQGSLIEAEVLGDPSSGVSPQIASMQRPEVKRELGAARVAQLEPSFAEAPIQGGRPDADGPGDGVPGLSALVAPVQVVNVQRREFSGHVYNLETLQGWYLANNIVTHNCTRAFSPVIESLLSRGPAKPQLTKRVIERDDAGRMTAIVEEPIDAGG